MAFDAHEKPPETLRVTYKQYQKLGREASGRTHGIVDFHEAQSPSQTALFDKIDWQDTESLRRVFNAFLEHAQPGFTGLEDSISPLDSELNTDAYICKTLPDLVVIPSLIPVSVQKTLLSRLFCRDLNNPAHNTNVHFHHNLQYPTQGQSFFDCDPECDDMIMPKDSSTHKPMNLRQFLTKKLRWVLLGGQYDWTAKEYPDEKPPPFPQDIARLLHSLFPETDAQAAIVNLYSPGDTLSLHRDVSEESDNGLVSLSIGCDGLFMIGNSGDNGEDSGSLVLRLHSGDAVYMAGPSRFAWHGVPVVLRDTCPKELLDFPGASATTNKLTESNSNRWTGWMATKRINLNVRQMNRSND